MGKVLVIGLGASGRSAARLLLEEGEEVTAVDQHAEKLLKEPEVLSLLEKGVILKDDKIELVLEAFKYVVVSPGISKEHPLYSAAIKSGKKVIGEIELACQRFKGQIAAVTGTNGKTTVTKLLEHILNASGRKALALGNIGTPLTSVAKGIGPEEIVALELSSFQIETLAQKAIDAAILLNITPDHLDRYHDMERYAQAKIKIKDTLKNEKAPFFVEEKTFAAFSPLFEGYPVKLYGYCPSCDFYTDLHAVYSKKGKEFSLPGHLAGKKSHDLENLLGSYAMCQFLGVGASSFLDALRSFRKPPHRIEFVRKIEGVSYYDDSKGTNIDAVMRAVEFLKGPIILIAGGVDKGASYAPWIKAFCGKVACILAIGEAKNKIKEEIHPAIPVHLFNDLQSCVAYAAKIARPKDNVLLSPGCSSFDMFKDYAHRGKVFQDHVMSLPCK